MTEEEFSKNTDQNVHMIRKNNLERMMEKAADNSVLKPNEKRKPIKHDKKRKKSSNFARAGIIALCLATAGGGGVLGYHIGHKNGDRLAINRETNNQVDDRIQFFTDLLLGKYEPDYEYDPITNESRDKNAIYMKVKQVKKWIGRDKEGYPLYNYGVDAEYAIADLLAIAAQVSEEEFRCALLGAYHTIREYTPGLRQRVLSGAFRALAKNDEAKGLALPEMQYVFSGSLDDYIKELRYLDYEDFVKHERVNIKKVVEHENKKSK
jgi:hypothetical protein